jgi:hypothetical protein
MSSTPEVVSAKEMDKKRKENIKEGSDERGHWRCCGVQERENKIQTRQKNKKDCRSAEDKIWQLREIARDFSIVFSFVRSEQVFSLCGVYFRGASSIFSYFIDRGCPARFGHEF